MSQREACPEPGDSREPGPRLTDARNESMPLSAVVAEFAVEFNRLLAMIRGVANARMARLASADPIREELEGIEESAGRAVALTKRLLATIRNSEPDIPTPSPANCGGTPATGKETVLLVEDDPGVRGVAAGTLRAHGYRVLEAGRPDEAISLADRHGGATIHILVTDLMMRGIPGRSLHAKLQLALPQIRVLFTGDGSEPDSRVAEFAVRDHVLNKPFAPARLASWVRAVLDGQAPDAFGP